MACEFKRAGFLEGEAIETPPPIGLNPSGDYAAMEIREGRLPAETNRESRANEDSPAPVQANSSAGLPVPNFKKTAPFESSGFQ